MKKFTTISVFLIVISGLIASSVNTPFLPHQTLSAYGFFAGKISEQLPAPNVVPYQLSTPLFSDYAEKLRFVYIPEGKKAVYNDSTVFDFPVGSVLIKTFYYPADFRKPGADKKLLETRLLVHSENGWTAWPYIWNDDQTEAYLDVAGETKKVGYTDVNGKKQKHNYIIPNQNQCKGCHNKSEVLMPIGPTARQLNFDKAFEYGTSNQLAHWASIQKLDKLPGIQTIPAAVSYNNPASGSIEQRARLWLDINCGHCHRPDGPAGTSGLYLHFAEKDPLHLGIGKTPVAAGRGSGNLKYSIVPGRPDESILLYRILSTDPGVMMPELGRTMPHTEGIALIKEWITSMKKNQP
jgi:uncharacterized repeat protein (TIGR03806 family)